MCKVTGSARDQTASSLVPDVPRPLHLWQQNPSPQMAAPCGHSCAQMSPFHEDTSHMGLGPSLMTQLTLITCKVPCSFFFF